MIYQRRTWLKHEDAWSEWNAAEIPTPVALMLIEGTRRHPLTIKVGNELAAAEYRIDPSSFTESQ